MNVSSTKAAKQVYLMHLVNNMNSESDDAGAPLTSTPKNPD